MNKAETTDMLEDVQKEFDDPLEQVAQAMAIEYDDPLHDLDFSPRDTSMADAINHVLSVVATRPFPYEGIWPMEEEDEEEELGTN